MLKQSTTEMAFEVLDSLRNVVIVLSRDGRIVFANRSFDRLLPDRNTESSFFDLLQDHRLSESLKEHIQSVNKPEYRFTALIRGHAYHFHVTQWGELFVCNGQSEDEIDYMYQLQVSSRKKMLDIKTKLLAVCMLDKTDFDVAIEQILAAACEILGCERVSFWEVNKSIDKITCQRLYLKSLNGLSNDISARELTGDNCAEYFAYINKEHAFIMADDIATHPATRGFYESYSKPLKLRSLLDVPVWHNNRLHGIICAEQVGVKKRWQLEDVQFMLSLSDSTSLCLQTRERIEAERKLAETNTKLKRSNADLEHFASVAAHDLKSPLRNMIGTLTMIRKVHGETFNSETARYIDSTIKNATHLNQLINDLLDYSKLDQHLGENRPVDIAALISDIQNDQKGFIEERKGQVVIHQQLPVVMGHRSLLYRLFANIIHNAIKYTHTHQPPVLEISYRSDTKYHYFSFADNGIGVDDKYAEKIFSLFGRLHNLQEFDGTGIGLATCKKIAEMIGGRIEYKRRENPVGSIFTIMLPVS